MFSLLVNYAKTCENADRSRNIPRKPHDVIDALDLFDVARFFTYSSNKHNKKTIYLYQS